MKYRVIVSDENGEVIAMSEETVSRHDLRQDAAMVANEAYMIVSAREAREREESE